MDHQYVNQGTLRPKTNRLTKRRKAVIERFKFIAANEGIPMGNETWKAGLLGCIRHTEQSMDVTLDDVNRWIKNHQWISAPVIPLIEPEEPVDYAPQQDHQELPQPPMYVPPAPIPDEVDVEDLFEPPPYVGDEVEIDGEGGFDGGSVYNEEEEVHEEDQQLTVQDEDQPEVLNDEVAYNLHQPPDNSFNAAAGQNFMLHNSHTEEVVHITHQYEPPPTPPNPFGNFIGHQQHQADGTGNDNGTGNGIPHYHFMHPFGQQDLQQQLYAHNYLNGYNVYPPPMYYPPPPCMWTQSQQPTHSQQHQDQTQPTVVPPPSPATTGRAQLDKAAQNIKTALLDMVKVQEYFGKHYGQTSEAFIRCTIMLRHFRRRLEDILKKDSISYSELRPSRAYKQEVHVEDLHQNEQQSPGSG